MKAIQASKNHCKVCFDTLIGHLSKGSKPKWPQDLIDVQVPIFVTWKKNGHLRGCIGTFSPGKLSQILPQYAVIAGVQDSRFPPISMGQLKELSVGVSLLINFQPNKKAYDWQIGKHGIICTLIRKGRKHSATYLPEVAYQQKWDKKQALESILQKAGYHGQLEEVVDEISITTYQSSKAELTYQEYSTLK